MSDDSELLIAFEFSVKQLLLERIVKDPLYVVARFLDFSPIILDAPVDQRPGVEHLQVTDEGQLESPENSEADSKVANANAAPNERATRDATFFSYTLAKGKSFLLRCALSGLKVRVDKLPLLVLLYSKPPTPTGKTRVIGSCLLRLGELLTRFRRRVVLGAEQAASDAVQSESDSSTQPLFDLNARVNGYVRLECAFVKYADAPPTRSNRLLNNSRFNTLTQPPVEDAKRELTPRKTTTTTTVTHTDAALQTEPDSDRTVTQKHKVAFSSRPRTLQPATVQFEQLDDEQAEQLVQPAPLSLALPRKTHTPADSPKRLVVNFYTPKERDDDSEREDDWTVAHPGELEPERKRQPAQNSGRSRKTRSHVTDNDAREVERKLQKVRSEYPLLAALLREILGPFSNAIGNKTTRDGQRTRSRSSSASRSPRGVRSGSSSPSNSVSRERGAYMGSTLAQSHASCPRLHRIPVESAARPDLSVLSRKPSLKARPPSVTAVSGTSNTTRRAAPAKQTSTRTAWNVRPTRTFLLRRENSAAQLGKSAAKHFERPELWHQTYVVS